MVKKIIKSNVDCSEIHSCSYNCDRPACIKAQRDELRDRLAAQPAEPDEIEQLRADLISCRGTVKTELNHYERLAGVHGKTPYGAAYEAEAQRLDALLDRIDAMMKDKP